ncbi:MAG TPA: DUF1343 domain-containing protein [bacterium]|nr:DUF1343 domain-containing protein [bacterium]
MKFFEGNRIGLIVNPASVDHEYRHACDIFAMQKEFKLTALFGPQHGIRGETQDNMIEWEGFTDGKTGVPVFSLYGNTRQPTDDMLADVDVLVFDVQDVGTRVYTFIYTMALSMISCARLGKRFVVLDRPNPIGGEVEGNLLDPSFASFVGLYPIPMRHGMTIAELARLFNYAFEINCELEVVPMEGWSREMSFEETELPWVFPSPNMPTPDTALVYPGSVLFEGTNISEARGTTRPFELIGAPWVNPHTLVKKLEAYDLPGVHFRECWFMPTFHKWSGVMCGGVQIHVTDRRRFPSYAAGVCLLAEIRAQATDSFEWKQPPYEYEYEKLPIDLICGTDFVRLEIEKGTNPLDIVSTSFSDLEKFSSLRGEYLLY